MLLRIDHCNKLLWSINMNNFRISFKRISVLLLLLVSPCYFQVTQGVVILSDTPQPRNVSAGTSVEFTCATPEIGLTAFAISTDVTLGNTMSSDVTLPNGDRQLTLSFIAPSKHQLITIACIASRINTMGMVDFNQSTAILMIQGQLAAVGNLTSSSEVDHCTLHFTWTAPYTLQGVPINYYTINITRHSDGAVLRSDTTNTTEYFYIVSSLGETLEVVVAAVNGAGTGNVSSFATQAGISSFEFMIDERIRFGDGWIFKSTIELRTICDDYEKVTVHLHDENSGEMHNTTANVTALPDGRRLVAHFHNIPEDTLYHATSKVHYTERSTQHSNQVNTSTFDIDHVNYTIINKFLHITVGFVEGTESHSFCVKVMCKSENIFESFNGSSGVINNVPQNELCILLITDADATNLMNSRPAFLANIQVSSATEVLPTNSVNVNTTPTPITKDDNQLIIVVVVAVAAAVAAAILLFIIISCVLICVLKVKHKGKKCMPTKIAVASTPLSVVVDCEQDDTAPPVPPYTEASSELFQNETNLANDELNPSTGQAQTQRQNEKPFGANKQFWMDAHQIDVSLQEPYLSWTPHENSIKMNHNDQQSQPTYEQPRPTCELPTYEQPTQYADMAIRRQEELIPKQPPGLGHTVYSAVLH